MRDIAVQIKRASLTRKGHINYFGDVKKKLERDRAQTFKMIQVDLIGIDLIKILVKEILLIMDYKCQYSSWS